MQGGQTPESSRNRAKAYTVPLKFLLALSWFQIKGFPMPDAVSNYWVIFHVFLYTNLSSHPLNPHKPLASTAKVWFLLVHLMTLNNMLSQKTKQILPIPSSVLAELSPIPPKKKITSSSGQGVSVCLIIPHVEAIQISISVCCSKSRYVFWWAVQNSSRYSR